MSVDALFVVRQIEEEVVIPVLLVELSHGAVMRHDHLIVDIDVEWGLVWSLHLAVDELNQPTHCRGKGKGGKKFSVIHNTCTANVSLLQSVNASPL